MYIEVFHSPKVRNLKSSLYKDDADTLVRFMPCITYFKQNLYLVSYRCWKESNYIKKPVTLLHRPGHPWYSFWKFNIHDSTQYVLIKIKKHNGKYVSTIVKEKKYVDMSNDNKADLRLRYVKPNHYEVLYSYWGEDGYGRLNPLKYKNAYSKMNTKLKPYCFYYTKSDEIFKEPRKVEMNNKNKLLHDFYIDEGCEFQMKSNLQITDQLDTIYTNTDLLCANLHKRNEKNISFIENKKQTYQYTISSWVFIKNCKFKTPMEWCIFDKLVNLYDNSNKSQFSKLLSFGCSTPLVSYSSTEYIAAGHFKIKKHKISEIPKNSQLYKMILDIYGLFNIKKLSSKDKRFHPFLIYGMFVYIIDKKSLKLKRSTPCFILQDTSDDPNALCYPSGITKIKNTNHFVLSYHENDINCKFLHFDKTEIEKLLIHKNNTDPKNFEFGLLYI